MKRGTLALAVLAVGLALPAGATGTAGGDPQTTARGGDGFEIRFNLRTRDGDPVALTRFRFSGLETTCDGGATVDASGRVRRIEINRRNRFNVLVERPDKRFRIRGRVSRDLERVRGVIRVRGDLGAQTGCDSGRVRWVASG